MVSPTRRKSRAIATGQISIRCIFNIRNGGEGKTSRRAHAQTHTQLSPLCPRPPRAGQWRSPKERTVEARSQGGRENSRNCPKTITLRQALFVWRSNSSCHFSFPSRHVNTNSHCNISTLLQQPNFHDIPFFFFFVCFAMRVADAQVIPVVVA